jgi:hypothetical protein
LKKALKECDVLLLLSDFVSAKSEKLDNKSIKNARGKMTSEVNVFIVVVNPNFCYVGIVVMKSFSKITLGTFSI